MEPSRDQPEERVEAVTFDVTHTLIHAPRLAEIYGEVLQRHGRTVPTPELRRRIPLVWQELSCRATPSRDRFTAHPGGPRGFWHRFLERLCEYLELAPPSRFASAELFDRFAHAEAWEVFADVPPALRALRRAGLRLGVIANWDPRLPELLERLGLAASFDAVVHSSALGVEKPHPLLFHTCLHELGVDPGRALHVGDSAVADVEGALAVGMRALRVDREGPRDSDLWRLLRPLLDLQPPSHRRDAYPGDRHVRP